MPCGKGSGQNRAQVPGTASTSTGETRREGDGRGGQITYPGLPGHPPSEAISGASSVAPCSCCLGPSCLLKGLRWACRNRASFSSYSIAPHLQGVRGRGRDENPAPGPLRLTPSLPFWALRGGAWLLSLPGRVWAKHRHPLSALTLVVPSVRAMTFYTGPLCRQASTAGGGLGLSPPSQVPSQMAWDPSPCLAGQDSSVPPVAAVQP